MNPTIESLQSIKKISQKEAPVKSENLIKYLYDCRVFEQILVLI